MISTRTAAAVSIFLLASLACLAQQPMPLAGHIGAQLPTGTIYRKKISPFTAVTGAPVYWNDRLKTNRQGRMRIALEDGSLLSLGADSELRVHKHDAVSQQTALELRAGRIRCQIVRLARANSQFELRTPTAVAGVIGTDFGADNSVKGVTRFICLTGTIQIRSSNPRIPGSVTCTAGQIVTVKKGKPPAVAEAATPQQLENWRHVAEPEPPPSGSQ